MPTQTISEFNDSELSVLSAISEAESDKARLTQRDLAAQAGISLGMANILLRRLAERGWVKLTRLSPKSMRYALTSAGITELARRTAGYFSRASKSAELYRDRLESFAIKVKRNGVGTVVLYGSSEVEFLLAYVCERHGLVFVKGADFGKAQALARKSKGILLMAEMEQSAPSAPGDAGVENLARVLAGVDQTPA
jgi:DNA-binding MarR family transcriptional regulator